MNAQDYTTSVTVGIEPQAAFNTINKVEDWWTNNFKGGTQNLNDVFTVSFGETFITLQVVELVPYKKIGWLVIDCHKHWLKDKTEWKGTRINWEISSANNATQIQFTHVGLVPGIECYAICEKSWDSYIQQSLFKLLTEEKAVPDLK